MIVRGFGFFNKPQGNGAGIEFSALRGVSGQGQSTAKNMKHACTSGEAVWPNGGGSWGGKVSENF
jgi:hypothetical protein